jgi:hypothetical protein
MYDLYGLYGFDLLYDLLAGASTACKQPSQAKKFGLNLLCSSLLAIVLKWPFFVDQYGPRMASAGYPKLALNLPYLLQLLLFFSSPSTLFFSPAQPHK